MFLRKKRFLLAPIYLLVLLFLFSCMPEKAADAEPPEGKKSNIVSAYYHTGSDAVLAGSVSQTQEMEFTPGDDQKIQSEDGIFLTTQASNEFIYQRFDLEVEEADTAAETLAFTWKGRASRLPEIHAWAPDTGEWIRLPREISRSNGNLAVTTAVKSSRMVSNGQVSLLVRTGTNEPVVPGKIPSSGDYDFTFAWITDTQYYSAGYPQIFDKITQYIADSKTEKKILYTIHTGDVVDAYDVPEQWENADRSMRILEKAGIPYGIAAGNHDVGFDKNDYGIFESYFGEKRFSGEKTYGGSPNHNRDRYDLISHKENKYIILYLGWQVEKTSIEWADKILKQFPDRKAIIALHAYINPRGAYIYQGQPVMDDLVRRNENVFMVLCGHYPGAMYNVKKLEGRVVYELLSDYQALPEGGLGYLRLLQFDAENGLIYVNTYSPHLDDYNYFEPEKEQFILPVQDGKEAALLRTDFIELKAVP